MPSSDLPADESDFRRETDMIVYSLTQKSAGYVVDPELLRDGKNTL